MKVQVTKRSATKKSEINVIRREGNIPAVLYQKDKEGEALSLDGNEFNTLLRKITPGRLSTTIFELVEGQSKPRRVLLKEIQYDPTNYKIIHLDLEELVDNTPISVKVPIECVGVMDCVGIKLGGNLRQVVRTVRVRCLPKDLPSFFQVDVRAMAVGDTKRLKDLGIPDSVRTLSNLNEVAVVISKF
jgi:large subunit ribosomal protein L25